MHIRQRIIDSCIDLMTQRGLHRLTMDDIAARSGISKRTLYTRFRSKDVLIEAVVDSLIHQIAKEIDLVIAAQHSPLEIMHVILNCLIKHGQPLVNNLCLQDLRQYYPHLWTRIEAIRAERIGHVIESISASRSNTLPANVSVQMCITVVTAAIQSVLTPEFILDNNLTFEEAVHQLSTILIKGIGAVE